MYVETPVDDTSNKACPERSFSALQGLKTHLRTTMNQQRLNNLLILYIYESETDSEIGNEFATVKESTLRML